MSSPTEMTATVVFKVGPVKATFSGKVTLSDLDPPNAIESRARAPVASRLCQGRRRGALEAEGPDVTCCTTTSTPRSAASSPNSARG
jgi:carbon monoxide dehydrogenase subunit G